MGDLGGGPGVAPPAGEGAAPAHAAAAEQEEEGEGGDGGHEDVEPALRPQLQTTGCGITEPEIVLLPAPGTRTDKRRRGRCHTSQLGSGHLCIKMISLLSFITLSLHLPVSCEVSEIPVVAWVAVGGGGVALAVEPAALQRRLLVPDADGAHHEVLRSLRPPCRTCLFVWPNFTNNDFLWLMHGQTQNRQRLVSRNSPNISTLLGIE